jgi:FkbM family methyltransferase
MYKNNPTCQIPNLEELFQKHFPDKTDGIFFDIGAYDGISFSNTWQLAEAGWRGVCVEPLPSAFASLQNNHNAAKHADIRCIPVAIGNIEGFGALHYTTPDGVLATLNKEVVEKNIWDEKYIGSIAVMVFRLDTILEANYEYGTPGFDVLNVDVEGGEIDVLKGFSVKYWEPKMVIIEAHESHVIEKRRFQADFINKYFEDAEYDKIYSDECNNIYFKRSI